MAMLQTVLDGFLERLRNVYTEMGMVIPEEFERVGEDLSTQRIQYVEAALEQATEEKVRW